MPEMRKDRIYKLGLAPQADSLMLNVVVQQEKDLMAAVSILQHFVTLSQTSVA